MSTHENKHRDDLSLESDRRRDGRARNHGCIEVHCDGSFKSVPVIEYSGCGARLVVGRAAVGDVLECAIVTSHYKVRSAARVVWTSPLSNGRTIIGVEFLPSQVLPRLADELIAA